MTELSLTLWLLLSLMAFVAGFISAIAGGGGMLILPLLLAVGLPPLTALGTAKLQGIFGLLASTFAYARSGLIEFARLRSAILYTTTGAACGIWLIQQVDTLLLERFLPVGLILICVYLLLFSTRGSQQKPSVLSDKRFNLLAGTGSGLYGGLFGPGIGSLLIAAFVAFRGASLLQAVANSKPLIFTSVLVSTAGLMFGGHIWWQLGLIMAFCQMTGAALGARMAIRKGNKFIQRVFIAVTLCLAMYLLLR